MNSPWIRYRMARPQARLRLFCFPYAGGAASIYLNWVRKMHPAIEICPIQLPGRQERIKESPVVRMNTMVHQLEQALLPYLDVPFAFFGHSMGALLAFEFTRQLRRNHNMLPERLFLSGRRAPQIEFDDDPIYMLPDAEFLKEIRSFEGTPDAVINNDELMQFVLPYLRADFELCETYRYEDEGPLDCALTVFCGVNDKAAPPISMELWSKLTSAEYDLIRFPGGHFFLHDHEDELRTKVEQLMLSPAKTETRSRAARTL